MCDLKAPETDREEDEHQRRDAESHPPGSHVPLDEEEENRAEYRQPDDEG